jgi:predicted alpha/beta superfamily hydrolase
MSKHASLALVALLLAGCGSRGSSSATSSVASGSTAAQTAAQTGTLDVSFEIETPSWTKGNVYVALDAAQNGKAAWAADGLRLDRGSDGRWRGTATVPAGTIHWKLTRGSWATVEKGWGGQELPDRETLGTSARAHVFHWGDDGVFDPQQPRLLDLGNWKPETLRARKVFVHLPQGYDSVKNHRWPVLYVLDGQNQFDPARAFGGQTWRLAQAKDAHESSGKAGFIAVAIDNTQDRMDEYTPFPDPQYGGGKLEDFARFLLDEVKPEIDRLFRTDASAKATGIMGSSLGGLASLHVGWNHSDRVGRVGAVSPSLWWDDERTLKILRSASSKPELRVWLDMGTNEGNDHAFYLNSARQVAFALVDLGFQWDKDLRHREFAGAAHNEAAWAARLPQVLAYLYP